ncbi:hypothetical protein JCM31739_08100 [Faecalimonas canis]
MILYKDIFNFDIILMKTILKEYGGNENAWKLFRHFYKDPDSYAITNKGCKSIQGIECTVDGLLSINRIREHENFGNKFVDTFAIYRKIPIIFSHVKEEVLIKEDFLCSEIELTIHYLI